MPIMNPDQILIQRFLQNPVEPLPVDSNPLAVALQTRLVQVDPRQGRVVLAFTPQSLFIQGTGVLQGGAVSAMLDFAMAFAVMASRLDANGCATVNLNTAFVRPAPQGAYRATGLIDKQGKNMAFAQARLERIENGALVATATSTLAMS